MSQKFKNLIEIFSKLPGIGPRQATRLALTLAEWPEKELEKFSEAIGDLKCGPLFCSECFNFAENGKCDICASTRRDKTKIAVVERVTDLEAMEKSGAFNGVYHVLGGAINPVDGVLPEKLKIKELESRIKKLKKFTPDIELIIATNPNVYGETTALYLEEEMGPLNIKISRLARGLSAGSTIEYADENTIAHALKHRK